MTCSGYHDWVYEKHESHDEIVYLRCEHALSFGNWMVSQSLHFWTPSLLQCLSNEIYFSRLLSGRPSP